MLATPVPLDVQVASATFEQHLNELWESPLRSDNGWERVVLDPLHCIVKIWACRPEGIKEQYFVRLGAEYYDQWPPTVAFVEPDTWLPVKTVSRWWPEIACPPWLGMHLNHPLAGNPGQLVCFSFTAEYYMVNHNPGEAAVWAAGTHTLAATLCRLQEALRPPYYKKPSA